LSIELIKEEEDERKNTILDIIEFEENKFCISCWDGTIKIMELYDNNKKYKIVQILPDHNNFVNCLKMLNFFKNEMVMASSSTGGIVILWKYENDKFNKFREIKLNTNDDEPEIFSQIESLEESVKYQELIGGDFHRKKIFFCNLPEIKEYEAIDINVNRCIRALKIIGKGEFLIVAGDEISIVKLENKSILIQIKYDNCEFNCVFQKQNGNLLITEYGNICKIREFRFNNEKLLLEDISIKQNDFKNYITTIIELDNGDLIIGGYDKTIKYFQDICK
jgi:WD40 repeat protein